MDSLKPSDSKHRRSLSGQLSAQLSPRLSPRPVASPQSSPRTHSPRYKAVNNHDGTPVNPHKRPDSHWTKAATVTSSESTVISNPSTNFGPSYTERKSSLQTEAGVASKHPNAETAGRRSRRERTRSAAVQWAMQNTKHLKLVLEESDDRPALMVQEGTIRSMNEGRPTRTTSTTSTTSTTNTTLTTTSSDPEMKKHSLNPENAYSLMRRMSFDDRSRAVSDCYVHTIEASFRQADIDGNEYKSIRRTSGIVLNMVQKSRMSTAPPDVDTTLEEEKEEKEAPEWIARTDSSVSNVNSVLNTARAGVDNLQLDDAVKDGEDAPVSSPEQAEPDAADPMIEEMEGLFDKLICRQLEVSGVMRIPYTDEEGLKKVRHAISTMISFYDELEAASEALGEIQGAVFQECLRRLQEQGCDSLGAAAGHDYTELTPIDLESHFGSPASTSDFVDKVGLMCGALRLKVSDGGDLAMARVIVMDCAQYFEDVDILCSMRSETPVAIVRELVDAF